MPRSRRITLAVCLAGVLWALAPVAGQRAGTATLDSPEQLIGFRIGTDRKLARWNQIVEYMTLADARSDRVRVREVGPSTLGQPFIVVEIGSPETLANLERVRRLERRLYFQDGIPSPAEREELFRDGKVVILITCSVHGHEIGATQMALELVHRLATENSSTVDRILDNVLILLVPSANPDGQVMVTDWYNTNLDTPYEGSTLPHLDHPYVGHDSNRDMYMLTQIESQYLARLAWHEWFPSIWLDQHQMAMTGPRMFVMPAADPINPNVHPLIYRWNAVLGQSQAAALEAAGKEGIIYNSTYTNFWQGALAWNGWWHNQIGVLTEAASVRIASPVDQLRVMNDGSVPQPRGPAATGTPLAPPTDVTPRTEYPRPWLGGRWTLRDIVDYELISTMSLLETAADRRETLLRQIYEVNRQTVEEVRRGEVASIVIPVERQRDMNEVGHLVERLRLGGVVVERAEAAFEVEGRRYAEGTFIVPMNQVFARYAKDLLERQTYPDVRTTPTATPEPPYDVTAWSLGMLLGVQVDFLRTAPPANLRTSRVEDRPVAAGRVTGNGASYSFDYTGADTATAINRLLEDGARVVFEGRSRVGVSRVARPRLDAVAREFGLQVSATTGDEPPAGQPPLVIRRPRIAIYSPWTGGNIDAGWTRWVLEQYGFEPTVINNPDIRRGGLRQRFDAIILADQNPREILDGYSSNSTRPEYRGGIMDAGVEQIARFLTEGGTLITLGAASDLAIDRLPVPVRNLKRNLRREQHFAPGSILRMQVDTSHPIGYGMAADTVGFYTNGPLFAPIDGLTSARTSVIARYPAADILASGWLRGEEQMAGRAAVVAIDLNPGRIVLFGVRPQHRAQTHATFPLLFNSLFLSTAGDTAIGTNQ